MANNTTGPTKQEIEAVFNRLRTQPANKSCFDCGSKTPTWSSVTYGVFICIDCSAVHRSLGVHVTFVRSTNLDTNWTWLQLRQMQLGGNANAAQYFRQHNCTTTDAQQKYNSRAAQLYRDKLATLAQQAMKVHGTKLYLDNHNDKVENNDNKEEEEDFFADCHNTDTDRDFNFDNNNTESNKVDISIKTTTPAAPVSEKIEMSAGAPSVDLLNSALASNTVTPSIGVRKIQPKKSGLGARKTGGLGATKVKANFAEIEQRANMAHQLKDGNNSSTVPEKTMSAEEELETVASMRLAYQDLSLQKNREEAKLKTIDPVKAKQMERLGMGFNINKKSDVSHSVLSDMQTIQQAPAPKAANSNQSSNLASFEMDSFFNMKYSAGMYSERGSSSGGGSNSKMDKFQFMDAMGFEVIEPIDSTHNNITSMFSGGGGGGVGGGGDINNVKTKSSTKTSSEEFYMRKSSSSKNPNAGDDNLAQRKFGSAKGFSSEQFFGNEQVAGDTSAKLSRFQGSNSISSADYFGDEQTTTNRHSKVYTPANFLVPDLEDVKESVRQGVNKVAGRMSSLASDVMSSLQDKYGY